MKEDIFQSQDGFLIHERGSERSRREQRREQMLARKGRGPKRSKHSKRRNRWND